MDSLEKMTENIYTDFGSPLDSYLMQFLHRLKSINGNQIIHFKCQNCHGREFLLNNSFISNLFFRRASRADISKPAGGPAGGGGGGGGNSLLVPASSTRRLSSPTLAPASSASTSRRGSFAATLGLVRTNNCN